MCFHILKIQQILFDIQNITDKELVQLTKSVSINPIDVKKSDRLNGVINNGDVEFNKSFYIDAEIEPNLDKIRTVYHITKSDQPRLIPVSRLKPQIKIVLVLDKIFDSSNPLSVYKDVEI
jgi:hypothetical protein